MKIPECAEFLQQCLPRLRFRWAGYRKVLRQVCKRLSRRISELELPGLSAYARYLDGHAEEWPVLDSLCHITISRLYRDRSIFDMIQGTILPSLAERFAGRENELRCWSAGCCSGEEAYTLQVIWKAYVAPLLHAYLPLRIIATDSDRAVLERAWRGCYAESSLRDVPDGWREHFFSRSGRFFTVDDPYRENIEFMRQDIREQLPAGSFHLILCRNLAFTYFAEQLQREILERIAERLLPGGILVIGLHETIPKEVVALAPIESARCIYRKLA